ncbi:MAG: hypothetical protein NWF11_05295 [Candidatus Bathyarchaeota archaeon]|nr:hypothetical protein [Candidatus Bathyarchaeota archaeon]
MPALLCKIGIHKWRDHGDRVIVAWKEPGLLFGLKATRMKRVYCDRECVRCNIRETRKFYENIDGTLAPAGWKRVTEDDKKS